MNAKILDLVKVLTQRDTKNLSQRGLKLAEECGEVAKNILPYENAAGSLHKFVYKEQIAENCMDTILVALSIAYGLGYTDDALESILVKKSLYWSSLQQNEDGINGDNLPHEIHVTVTEPDSLEHFVAACKFIEVKPIVLDLHTKTDKIKDIMTSSVFVGSSPHAYEDMLRIERELTAQGFNVTRGKIEVPPFHPAVPSAINNFQHVKDRYFETHIEVVLDGTDSSLSSLREWADQNDAHLSANYFKRDADTSTIMVTFRSDKYFAEYFTAAVRQLRESLCEAGFTINGKIMIEYCLYDSNMHHDIEWTTVK